MKIKEKSFYEFLKQNAVSHDDNTVVISKDRDIDFNLSLGGTDKIKLNFGKTLMTILSNSEQQIISVQIRLRELEM